MTQYVVFDNKGIIHESSDMEETLNAFENEDNFVGDLIFAEIITRRH